MWNWSFDFWRTTWCLVFCLQNIRIRSHIWPFFIPSVPVEHFAKAWGRKNTWIPACPLGKQLSPFASLGNVQLVCLNLFGGWLALMYVYVRRANFTTIALFWNCKVAKFCINISIPKAVELNRITKHIKCKCKEFFFQTRHGGEIWLYDVITHKGHYLDPCPLNNWVLKVTCPSRKSTHAGQPDETFLGPCKDSKLVR